MATHQVIRTITSHGHQYRQRVELYYDPKKKQTRTRFLESLGPVQPAYHRGILPTPILLPLETPHLGLLATHMMMGSLTAAQVIDTVREMGQEVPPGDLIAVGIRYDLGGKNLALLLWLAPPSPAPRSAPSANPPSSRKEPGSPTRSPSKAKRA